MDLYVIVKTTMYETQLRDVATYSDYELHECKDQLRYLMEQYIDQKWELTAFSGSIHCVKGPFDVSFRIYKQTEFDFKPFVKKD